MTKPTSDVVVVGGGIVGAACVLAFARRRMKVLLLESRIVAGGATGAGMGHVVVMDDSEAQFALTRYSRELWDEIADELPEDCEHQQCGTIWLAADDEEMDVVRRKHAYYTERGVAAEILDAAALAEAEPNLRPGLAGGLRVPGDRVVYPPCVTRWLLEKARQHDVEIKQGVAARDIRAGGVLTSDGELLSTRVVINATGTWAPEHVEGLQVHARKGHLVITDRYPGFVHHQLIELGYLKSAHAVASDSVAFNVQPRDSGQLLVGSSRQYGDCSSEIDSGILGRMVRRAMEYLPGVGGLSALRAWTGLRAATPDKLPLIGPVQADDTLYLATGHEGLGITMSLGTAELLVDRVLARQSKIPREPYLPSRFD